MKNVIYSSEQNFHNLWTLRIHFSSNLKQNKWNVIICKVGTIEKTIEKRDDHQ